MADQRQEVSHQSQPPPYADPLSILVPPNSIVDQVPLVVPPQNGLKKYFPSLLLFIFLFYMITQIVFACFSNCSLPNTNLRWIRASFFLNIPAVLILCIRFIQNYKRRKISSLLDFANTIMLYSIFFGGYLMFYGIVPEVKELMMIQNVLGNTTVISLLPCSTSYYENMFRLKISHLIFAFSLFAFSFLRLCYAICAYILEEKLAFSKERCNRLISPIINRWRSFIGTLCGRHQQETFIQRSERY